MIRLPEVHPAVLIPSSLSFVLLLLAGCAPHSHGPESSAAGEGEIGPAAVTLFGERVLLFMEHPRLVAGEPARFLAHFSVLATGEPVRAGRVELVLGDTRLAVDAPMRDGLFTPEGPFPRAGRLPARITVTSEQVRETLDLGLVSVHPDEAAAREAAEAEGSGEPADAVPFLMEQQWKIGLLLAEAGPRRLVERLVLPAQVVAAEGATAEVVAPVNGRLIAPTSGAFPRSGDLVEAGQELALLEPPLSAADAAQLRALDLQWNLESLAVERGLADALAQSRFAEREHERIAGLRPSGLATQQQLDLAERDLALAQGQLAAAESGRRALDALRARSEREAWSAEGTLRLRLAAPIAGQVVAAGPVLGEAVEAGETVFRIVDRTRLWIEGHLSEFDVSRLSGAEGAVASFPGLAGLRLDVAPLAAGGLFQRAPEVDPVTRTLRLRASLPGAPGTLHPGMLAELAVAVASMDAPVTVPAEAVVLDQGLPTAYVLLGGESFQRRGLVLGLRDGDLVEVREGVLPGEHVATRGAATIRMAALSPSEFGHGHAH
jgi:RND family efflux transporter MFP subunit